MARTGLFFVLAASTALAAPLPPRPGTQALAPASCGARETLWIRHYTAALYLPPREPAIAAMQDPKRPKALQIQLRSRSLLPRDIPPKWRHTLEQQLDPGEFKRVREAYFELRAGDVITLAYAPGAGLDLRVNDQLVARTPSHGLVEAMLLTWAGKDPVTERLQRVLATHPCRA